MKRLFVSQLLVMLYLNIFSQGIGLTFVPTDETLTIDSVFVKDLKTGNYKTYNDADNIDFASITNSSENYPVMTDNCVICPNPFENKTTLKYVAVDEDHIVVKVINSIGEIVSVLKRPIKPGIHEFELSVQKKGIYIISIIGERSSSSAKAICVQQSISKNRLNYVGYSNRVVQHKSINLNDGQSGYFEVFSGKKTTVIVDTLITSSKTYFVDFYKCEDRDGNNYKIVQIGDQWWMAENLRATKYLNGDSIPYISDQDEWIGVDSGAYCYYDNEVSNSHIYGNLYNWFVVDDERNVAPEGWHVPSDEEWTTLSDFLGGEGVAGGKMKSRDTLYWESPNLGATNSSGFTGLPGGQRVSWGESSNHPNETGFRYIRQFGHWHCTTEYDDGWPYYPNGLPVMLRWVYYKYNSLEKWDPISKINGLSIRCLKD